MRDVQAFGRFVLYAVLAIGLLSGVQDNPGLFNTAVVLLAVGPVGYWFWTLKQHRATHDESPRVHCSHCRERLSYLREQEERERMAALNAKYRA